MLAIRSAPNSAAVAVASWPHSAGPGRRAHPLRLVLEARGIDLNQRPRSVGRLELLLQSERLIGTT
jgi:hypothetical protein